jgi:hypothetical protein
MESLGLINDFLFADSLLHRRQSTAPGADLAFGTVAYSGAGYFRDKPVLEQFIDYHSSKTALKLLVPMGFNLPLILPPTSAGWEKPGSK